MNSERINPDKFGDDKITRFSTIKTMQFDENLPNWIKLSALVE